MYKQCLVLVSLLLVLTTASQVKLTFKIVGASSSSDSSSAVLAQKLAQQLSKGSLGSLKVHNYSISYVNGTDISNPTGGSTGNAGSTGNVGGSTGIKATSSELGSSTGGANDRSAASSKGASFYLISAILMCLFNSRRSSFLAFVLLFALLVSNANAFGVYQNCRVMDTTTQYKLHWNINSTYINFAIEAKSKGWIGFGISQNGDMDSGGKAPGSDIFLGHFGGSCSSNGCVNDYSTVVYDKPVLDATQNIDFIAASNENGVMTFEFGRKLKTGDSKSDLDIPSSGDVNVIWAVNTMYAPTDSTTFSKHDERGPAIVDFSSVSSCSGTDPIVEVEIVFDDLSLAEFDQPTFMNSLSDLGIDPHRIQIESTEDVVAVCPDCSSIDLVYSEYSVPAEETSYVCLGFTFPTDKQHVIRMQPIVNNSAVLHHMILWVLLEGSPAYSTTPQLCNMAPGNALPAFAWAPGSGDTVFPDVAGYLIGSEAKVAYGVLNMHYNNPGLIKGLKDSSGVRLITTKTLRPQNAGMMLLGGSTEFIEIPARQPSWMFSGTCPSQYTSYLPSNITVFSSMAHMHYQGRKLWTEQWRAGKYIGNDLGESLNYDFNFQHSKKVDATIMPGDNLITRCVYDTTNKTTVTQGGEASAMEMCYNLIMYYPIFNIITCTGSETSGCNCTYGKDCVNSTACNLPYGATTLCSSHGDCSSCSADTRCVWCDSPYIVGCMSSNLKDSCTQNLQGKANQCGSITGTSCSLSHKGNCNACVSDTANSCNYCKRTNSLFETGDTCISGASNYQTAICNGLGGTLGCN